MPPPSKDRFLQRVTGAAPVQMIRPANKCLCCSRMRTPTMDRAFSALKCRGGLRITDAEAVQVAARIAQAQQRMSSGLETVFVAGSKQRGVVSKPLLRKPEFRNRNDDCSCRCPCCKSGSTHFCRRRTAFSHVCPASERDGASGTSRRNSSSNSRVAIWLKPWPQRD